jgi:hypothetical protein
MGCQILSDCLSDETSDGTLKDRAHNELGQSATRVVLPGRFKTFANGDSLTCGDPLKTMIACRKPGPAKPRGQISRPLDIVSSQPGISKRNP